MTKKMKKMLKRIRPKNSIQSKRPVAVRVVANGKIATRAKKQRLINSTS